MKDIAKECQTHGSVYKSKVQLVHFQFQPEDTGQIVVSKLSLNGNLKCYIHSEAKYREA